MRFGKIENELEFLVEKNYIPQKECFEEYDGMYIFGCDAPGEWSYEDHKRMEEELRYVDKLLLRESFHYLNDAITEENGREKTKIFVKVGGAACGMLLLFMIVYSSMQGNLAW